MIEMQVGTKSVGERKDERAVKKQIENYLSVAGRKTNRNVEIFRDNLFMNFDPYYSCFPKMCWGRVFSLLNSTIQKGKYRTEEKCLLYIRLCFLYSVMETSLEFFHPLIVTRL